MTENYTVLTPTSIDFEGTMSGIGNDSNNTSDEKTFFVGGLEEIQWDDATWILTSGFIIFTMQSGFGLLESGSVSVKNEVNIMIKNAVDVLFGGLTYWMVGFGLNTWVDGESNQFMGTSNFFVDADKTADYNGHIFSLFFFQTSFATTATTIVSGSMAERTKLESYIIFSVFNTFVYCFPSHWMWRSKESWLHKLGAIDLAGKIANRFCICPSQCFPLNIKLYVYIHLKLKTQVGLFKAFCCSSK